MSTGSPRSDAGSRSPSTPHVVASNESAGRPGATSTAAQSAGSNAAILYHPGVAPPLAFGAVHNGVQNGSHDAEHSPPRVYYRSFRDQGSQMSELDLPILDFHDFLLQASPLLPYGWSISPIEDSCSKGLCLTHTVVDAVSLDSIWDKIVVILPIRHIYRDRGRCEELECHVLVKRRSPSLLDDDPSLNPRYVKWENCVKSFRNVAEFVLMLREGGKMLDDELDHSAAELHHSAEGKTSSSSSAENGEHLSAQRASGRGSKDPPAPPHHGLQLKSPNSTTDTAPTHLVYVQYASSGQSPSRQERLSPRPASPVTPPTPPSAAQSVSSVAAPIYFIDPVTHQIWTTTAPTNSPNKDSKPSLPPTPLTPPSPPPPSSSDFRGQRGVYSELDAISKLRSLEEHRKKPSFQQESGRPRSLSPPSHSSSAAHERPPSPAREDRPAKIGRSASSNPSTTTAHNPLHHHPRAKTQYEHLPYHQQQLQQPHHHHSQQGLPLLAASAALASPVTVPTLGGGGGGGGGSGGGELRHRSTRSPSPSRRSPSRQDPYRAAYEGFANKSRGLPAAEAAFHEPPSIPTPLNLKSESSRSASTRDRGLESPIKAIPAGQSTRDQGLEALIPFPQHRFVSVPTEASRTPSPASKSSNTTRTQVSFNPAMLHTNARKDGNVYLWQCPVCQKPFMRKSSLVRHEKTHTGERPYGCPHCEKRFIQKSDLNRHIGLHTGQKPFKCSQCDKSYTQSNSLLEHSVRAHQCSEPYPCPHCPQRFMQRHMLTLHLTKGHRLPAPPPISQVVSGAILAPTTSETRKRSRSPSPRVETPLAEEVVVGTSESPDVAADNPAAAASDAPAFPVVYRGHMIEENGFPRKMLVTSFREDNVVNDPEVMDLRVGPMETHDALSSNKN